MNKYTTPIKSSEVSNGITSDNLPPSTATISLLLRWIVPVVVLNTLRKFSISIALSCGSSPYKFVLDKNMR